MIKADIAVIGGGPGGYTAAFYAAANGKKVVLVEKEERLGGVCLNRGCIPSKALLHVAKLIRETQEAERWGVEFLKPVVHLSKLRAWKNSVLAQLTQGLANLAGRRAVQVLRGRARFQSPTMLEVGEQQVSFDHAIIATGSVPALPEIFSIGDKRVMTSTEALEIDEIPQRLLVVGGGYIGMELGTVYAALGSKVVVAEALSGILAGADADLVRFVHDRALKTFQEVRVNARVLGLKAETAGIRVTMEAGNERKDELYDRVLVAVGRTPVTDTLGLEQIKVSVNERGFIPVDPKQQTTAANIYAIGDVVGGALLAHKASNEAKVAVDHILKGESQEGALMPAVVFTDPELAWCGMTEAEAKVKNIPVQIVKFPWSASGRAMTLDRIDGVTKLLIDPQTEKIVGAGICGTGAGELISEAALAIRSGTKAKDLASLVHPHPTLSETWMECSEMFYGHAIHAYSRKRS